MNNTTQDVPSALTFWHEGLHCCEMRWEEAYSRFETAEQEIAKFLRRYQKLGIDHMPKSTEVVELFCGRGNGLKALERLGFKSIEGVDLSPTLLQAYLGPAKLYVADCRQLSFGSASKDLIAVQGGLHHLPELPSDLESVLMEIHRILRPGGRCLLVEPWLTPFLRGVHFACRRTLLRRLWGKLDALATMIELEQTTYFNWLSRSSDILTLLHKHFVPIHLSMRAGKLSFVGQKQ